MTVVGVREDRRLCHPGVRTLSDQLHGTQRASRLIPAAQDYRCPERLHNRQLREAFPPERFVPLTQIRVPPGRDMPLPLSSASAGSALLVVVSLGLVFGASRRSEKAF